MLEKVTRIAEQTATNVSRRQFLGRFGKGAVAAAGAAAGLLACSSRARAGRRPRICSLDSVVPDCKGLPVNSPCIAPGGVEGRCFVTAKIDGVNYCNECRIPGPKRTDKPPKRR